MTYEEIWKAATLEHHSRMLARSVKLAEELMDICPSRSMMVANEVGIDIIRRAKANAEAAFTILNAGEVPMNGSIGGVPIGS
jgi:hypothetical protein